MGIFSPDNYIVAWGPLDLLVVDMPPGTGDVQLSISQNIPVDGAIIITTPQGLAVSNARRGLEMLKKVNIPILGIVENMSDFTCPSCGHRSLLFHDDCDPMTPIKDKTSGGLGLAEATGTQLLARLPIDQRICTSGELGRPLVLGLAANSIAHPGTAVHQPASLQAYDQLARLLLTRLSEKFSPRP
ncbi:unnamed protein product [Protopolystoma xenopodis]|uniref:Uncharacterized protein n=1 Tax=Protopolystoma xenopodis TaxID=117903 RepID=A0A448WBQ8_9PLAT|nr:unnamed protein product [Protopolystoma xenopodis]